MEDFSLECQRSLAGKVYEKISWNCPVWGKKKVVMKRQDGIVENCGPESDAKWD